MRREHLLANGKRLILLEGDITRIPVDAIANAANSALVGGGGVDGAIHRAGGPAIMAELDRLRAAVAPLAAGQAVATSAGNLPARFVFHAVGPIWHGGGRGEAEALASCYRVCLDLAEQKGLRSISLPSISTGIYAYPTDAAAQIAIGQILDFLDRRATSVAEVWMVLFGASAFTAYEAALKTATAR
jgi:O-acetyl-ADP-ribose deacetylase (regulator of RNase III)